MTSWTTREALFSSVVLSLLVACSGSDGLPLDASGGAPVGQGGNVGPTTNGGSTNPATGGAQSQATGGAQTTGGSISGGTTNGGSATGGTTTGGTSNGGSATGGKATGGTSNGGNATGGKATGGSSNGGSTTGGNTTGGKATGGASNGGTVAGGTSNGGNATGGKATGGASSGGTATGGASSGGMATGGAATGGRATGGTATGGAATGGRATGGTATGGAATGGSGNSSSTCPTALGNGTCPAKSCPTGATDCGCYNFAGLGATKKEILDAGGDSRFMASAMVETENLKADYTLGDGKTGDAFNAGRCKQNWYMTRQCHTAWNSLGASSYSTSTAMNSDLKLDIQVYNECRAKWSESVWFAGHRNGQTGLTTGQAPNLALFIAASKWTQTNLENGHLCDNVRFWATVPAIVVE